MPEVIKFAEKNEPFLKKAARLGQGTADPHLSLVRT
jgi:hypothetical protein